MLHYITKKQVLRIFNGETMENITVPKLAEMLGLSRVTVYRWVKSRKIEAEKIGPAYIITDKHILAILNKDITKKSEKQITKAVEKVVSDYGETLRLLGKE